MKVIELKCGAHLGDCLIQLRWCIKVCKTQPDIELHYWVSDSYHGELSPHIDDDIKDRLILENLHFLDRILLETWSQNDQSLSYWSNNLNTSNYVYWDIFYIYFFDKISKYFGIENPIKSPYDFLFDSENLLKPNILSGEYDYLILNSVPASGQCYIYNKEKFIDLTQKLVDNGNKVITTEPTGIEGVLSTMEHNLSLIEIGNLSINSKNIISVHTGTIHNTLNIFNINKVENRYIINTAWINYTYRNCHYIDNFDTLYQKLNLDI